MTELDRQEENDLISATLLFGVGLMLLMRGDRDPTRNYGHS